MEKLQNERPPRWLRSKSVKELLSISNLTLQSLRISGAIPAYRLGSSWFYKEEEIIDALEKVAYLKKIAMNEYVAEQKFRELEKKVEGMVGILTRIESRINKEDELWDNPDLITKWKISARTLADWRSKGLIGYTQVGGKIFYTALDRQNFLNNNHRKV